MNGKLKSALDKAGEEQYLAYDFKGNLLQKQRKVIKDSLLTGTTKFQIDWDTGVPNDHLDTQIFETTTDYDALNRIQKVTLPEDTEEERKEIIPHYNRAGALVKVELNEEEYVKEIVYNAKGQRLLISFGNGVMNRYTYDPQNFRLLRMKAEKYTFSETATERTYAYNSGTNRQDLGYEYDLNGNILKKKNRTPDCGISGTILGVDALDNQYTYDAINRLLSGSGRESDTNNESHRWADAPVAGSPNANNTQAYTRNYTYDKVGNIQSLQQTGTNAFTRTFNYTDNTLDDITVSGTPTDFTYDANGNLITSGSSRFYEWNEKDQLAFFKIDAGGEPSVYAHYLYDSGGNRVKKIVWDQQGNKEVTVYIDDIFEYRLKEEDSTDKEQNIIHIMDDSARIAQVRIGTEFNDDISETVHYVLDDHLGSSTTRLDATGSVIDRQEFYPFGDTSLRTYSKKRFQFIGREKDAESGLYYWSARYYSSWMCRFISVDKMASSYAHLTPYNYADNDPINDFDIDGNQNKNTEQTPKEGKGDLLTNKGQITKAGQRELSNYPKKVIHAVEKFASEVQSYLKENEDATLDDAISATNVATQDEDWVYVQIKSNNSSTNTNWRYKAYHAGLVYKTLNFQEGDKKLVAKPIELLSDQTSNKYLEDFYSIPDDMSIKGLRVYNKAKEKSMVTDIVKGGVFEMRDSTVFAGDSLDIIFSKEDYGRAVGISTDINPDNTSNTLGKPFYAELREEKQAGKGLKFAPVMNSHSGKISKIQMQKFFTEKF